mgnify:CR=1 FL=1|jgi:amino acid permease
MEEQNGHKIGVAYGFFYVVNCTIGAGFLVIPWAYQHAGIVFSAINQVVIAVMLLLLAF